MGQGIQVLNESGQVVFDSSTRTIKVLTIMPITKNMNVSFTHPLLSSANDIPVYILTPAAQAGFISNVNVIFNGSTATVTTGNINSTYTNADIMQLIIGVY